MFLEKFYRWRMDYFEKLLNLHSIYIEHKKLNH